MIGIVNSDDILKPDALKTLVKYYKNFPNADFFFGSVKKHWGILHGYNKWKIHYTWGFYSGHSTGFYIKKDAAKIVDQVIDQIAVYRGEMGSFQKNMLESNLNSLKINEENITQAESTIRDTKMASEMSSLTKDKIMLQSSTAMIAQDNQVPKTVLDLIKNS